MDFNFTFCFKARTVALSPDQRSASWNNSSYGGVNHGVAGRVDTEGTPFPVFIVGHFWTSLDSALILVQWLWTDFVMES